MQTLAHPVPTFNIRRLSAVVLLAVCCTFALFVFMQKLISNDERVRISPTPTPIITLQYNFEDEPLITKPKLKPKPKHEPTPKPIPKLIEAEPQVNLQPGLYASNYKGPTIKTSIKPNLGVDDGVARPIVRIEPKYPIAAARDGQEGWVKLSFSITPSGTVSNVKVVDAEPKRVFNQEAKRALAKWKYKPNIVGGKAHQQDGLIVMLDFKLAS